MQKELFDGLSIELEKILKAHKKNTLSIIDQTGKYSNGENLAIYGHKYGADAAIRIYFESTLLPENPKAQRIDLVLNFCTLMQIANGVQVIETMDKKYNLWTGKEPGPQLTFSENARDFMDYLTTKGYL